MAAALMMVDGVHILDRKKVSPSGLGSQGQGGTQCTWGSDVSRTRQSGPYAHPLNLLSEREAIVVTQSLICLQKATWGGARGMMGWGMGRIEIKSETEQDQTQVGWWLCLEWFCSVCETSKSRGLRLQEGVGWKSHVAPPWPLPQGLLGEVASEGLLLSRRASKEGGVGLRNSFLGRRIEEKGTRDF